MQVLRTMAGVCLGLLIAYLLVGCGEADEPAVRDRTGPPRVYVVNYPLMYMAQRIGGDAITVHFPAPEDVDPADWTPDPETVRAYQQADLVLLNGAGYARWLEHVSLPEATLIDTSAAFHDRLLHVPDAIVHAHPGQDHAHTHAGLAFTTWLDMTLAIEHARAVAAALGETLPEQAQAIDARFEALAEELGTLDQRLSTAAAALQDTPLVVSHPVYHYLQERYGLNIRSVHWEPNEMPGDDEWAALDALLAEHPARWMLWEDEPDDAIAQRLLERGVRSAVFNPCANQPAEGDFLTVMQQNVARFEQVSSGAAE